MSQIFKLKTRLVVFLCLISNYINAQALEDYTRLKKKYPEADVICTEHFAEINFKMDKGKPRVFYTTKEELYFLGDNNNGYTKRAIHYSGFYALVSYSAILYTPNGKGYKKEEIKDFKVNDFVNNNIFHDDSKELSFRFPMVVKGAKTIIETVYEIKDLHMMPKLYVSPFLDYEKVLFKISFPKEVSIAIDTFRLQHVDLKFAQQTKGGITLLIWDGFSKKRLDYEGNGPDTDYLSSQLHIRIKSYKGENGTVQILSNLDDLYRWNCSFLKETWEEPKRFKNLSDSIIGLETDELRKAAKLFEWVQNNIRYIALEAGYAGLIPAKASIILTERYGDCKGMANILYNLLRSQDMQAYLAWIGSRDLPYKYTELPSPQVDNHMICALKYKGKFIFLDATSTNLPFGMPSAFIQGKEALIGLEDCEHYAIETVEEVIPESNFTYDSCYLKLDGKSIIGSGKATLTGYKRVNFVDRLAERNYNFLLKQCRSYLIKGSNRFTIDTVWLENLNDRNKPLYIYYAFKIPEFGIVSDDEIFLNLNLEKIANESKIDSKRNVPLEYYYKRKNENVICLELNPKWKTSYIPENISWEKEHLSFNVTYSLEKNVLIRKEVLKENTLMMYPSEFPAYNKMIEIRQKAYAEQTIIKQ